MSDMNPKSKMQRKPPEQQVKVVAEMPEDEEMRDKLEETKEHDGYPGSCGI
jgi:hypothetical protein